MCSIKKEPWKKELLSFFLRNTIASAIKVRKMKLERERMMRKKQKAAGVFRREESSGQFDQSARYHRKQIRSKPMRKRKPVDV